MITITQGDSLAQDIECADLPTYDLNWNGVWGITKSIGLTPIIQGNLTFSDDYKYLCLRILPAETDSLAAGKYYLIVRVNNDTTNFSQQIQRQELVIEKRGI